MGWDGMIWDEMGDKVFFFPWKDYSPRNVERIHTYKCRAFYDLFRHTVLHTQNNNNNNNNK